MAFKPLTYFLALFQAHYKVKAADMQDLCNSILFWDGNGGYTTLGLIVAPMPAIGGTINQSGIDLFIAPKYHDSTLKYLVLQNNNLSSLKLYAETTLLVSIDLSNNKFNVLSPDTNWIGVEQCTLNNNLFSSFNVPAELLNLKYIEFRNNPINSLTFDPLINKIVQIELHNTDFTSWNVPDQLNKLVAIYFNECMFTSLTFENPPITMRMIGLHNCLLAEQDINILLGYFAPLNIPIVIDLTGFGNAPHGLWTAQTLAYETAIKAAGGNVFPNP